MTKPTRPEIKLLDECQYCWAKCCNKMAVNISLGKEMRELLSAHYSRPITKLMVRINHRCDQLDENNLCKLFDSELRPAICDRWICPESMRPHVLRVDHDGQLFEEDSPTSPQGELGIVVTIGGNQDGD